MKMSCFMKALFRLCVIAMVCTTITGVFGNANPAISDLKNEDLLVFKGWAWWQDNHPTLRNYLNHLALEKLDEREKEIQNIRGARAWRNGSGRLATDIYKFSGKCPNAHR